MLLLGVLLGALLTNTVFWDAVQFTMSKLKLRTGKQLKKANDTHSATGYTYGMDHELLNLSQPNTLWLNMGYWKDTEDFVQACRALAKKVIDPLKLEQGARVLDCGFGCGDQDLYLMELHPSCSLIGVTSEVEQASIAHKRVTEAGLASSVTLYSGDAVDPASWRSADSGRPFSHQEFHSQVYDAILSLDSCYHYNTRQRWLQLCSTSLRKHGRFSCSDLILGPGIGEARKNGVRGQFTLLLLRAVLSFTGAPWENFVEEKDYISRLEESGFTEVQVIDISDHVFPGLGGFVTRHKRSLGGLVAERKWWQYEGAARLFNWLHRNKLICFVLANGSKA
ncbi:hypothetical protein PhCBS80983_g03823 [Powellomyces hirtus]|uniref:phosphoethanolamine N-methyltransferase n=1 Tax=Powellomyces hirtus TaxID=109895 RepID=A0A507E0U2_9FUNG|nr:hypothetical protein PhCBS80983_g03823 [Powellomyces hirtus]